MMVSVQTAVWILVKAVVAMLFHMFLTSHFRKYKDVEK